MVYLISYEISNSSPEDYQPLRNLLAELQATEVLHSQWLLVSKSGVSDIFEDIRKVLHERDGLLVHEVYETTRKSLNWQNLRISDDRFRGLIDRARDI
jgi:hypothetical protein